MLTLANACWSCSGCLQDVDGYMLKGLQKSGAGVRMLDAKLHFTVLVSPPLDACIKMARKVHRSLAFVNIGGELRAPERQQC